MEFEWQIIMAEKIATFLSVIIAVGTALYAKDIASNWLAGRRLTAMGLAPSVNIRFNGKKCKIKNVGKLKTEIINIEDEETYLPFKNERLENEKISVPYSGEFDWTRGLDKDRRQRQVHEDNKNSEKNKD